MIGSWIGGLLGLFIAAKLGADGGAVGVFTVFCAGLGYLGWCGLFPIKMCWRCKGKAWVTDGHGGMRERPCWRCKRRRLIRRPGARLIGAVGRRT